MLCRRCGQPVTLGLRRLDRAGPPLGPGTDDCDLLERGTVVFGNEREPSFDLAVGTAYVHVDDLIRTAPAGDRSGCCGPTGLSGPNRRCIAGHPVAVEAGDCIAPHFAALPPDLTVPQTLGDDSEAGAVHVFASVRPCRHRSQFTGWLHAALEIPGWYGDDIEGLLTAWQATATEPVAILWAHAQASREAGLRVDAIARRFTPYGAGEPPISLLLG